MRHALPLNDIKDHEKSIHCPCGPRLYEGDGDDMVFHYYFDRRDFIAAIEIYLGYRCKGCLRHTDPWGNHREKPPPYDETK
jgi:hypothetical protein